MYRFGVNLAFVMGLIFMQAQICYARKTSNPIIQDPFDLAAGGAVLTRAARQSVILANPALMPYGAKFHRWIGTQFGVLANKESVDFLNSMIKSASGGGGDSESDADSDQTSSFIDTVFKTPIHAGFHSLSSWTTNNLGIAIFGSTEVDIQAREFGVLGMPEISFGMDTYAGVALGFGIRLIDQLSVGVTAKTMLVAEPNIAVSLVDQSQIAELSEPGALLDAASYGRGTGYDAGALLFLQGSMVDYRFALKVEDVGNTTFAGTQAPFLQTVNAGTSLTFHNSVDSIHLAVDYRDIQNAYKEHWFKRAYAGARIVLRNYIGLAYGLYQGWPSYGVRLDLLFAKIGATAYTKELGDYPGQNPRNLYQVYFMTGF